MTGPGRVTADDLAWSGAQPVAPDPAKARRRAGTATWLVPLGLVLLAVVPMFGGAVRLVELAGDVQVTPDNDRVFITTPVPIVVHIVTAGLYTTVGAWQFSSGLRRRWPRWHRTAGRVLVPLGLSAALSALWMTHFYPWPLGTGGLLYALRLLFGSAMAYGLVRGFVAIRRRDVRVHRAWMIRAYAIGLGAGTQVLTLGFGQAGFGEGEVAHALLMAAGWVINLVVAEWAIRGGRPGVRALWRRPVDVS